MEARTSGGTDSREVEWQFDALDLRPVVRWLAEPAGAGAAEPVTVAAVGTVNQVDLYLDTDDRRFHRAGYALRIRRTGRGGRAAEGTLKALDSVSPGEPGLRNRRELS